jgi:hypothetical protein
MMASPVQPRGGAKVRVVEEGAKGEDEAGVVHQIRGPQSGHEGRNFQMLMLPSRPPSNRLDISPVPTTFYWGVIVGHEQLVYVYSIVLQGNFLITRDLECIKLSKVQVTIDTAGCILMHPEHNGTGGGWGSVGDA